MMDLFVNTSPRVRPHLHREPSTGCALGGVSSQERVPEIQGCLDGGAGRLQREGIIIIMMSDDSRTEGVGSIVDETLV